MIGIIYFRSAPQRLDFDEPPLPRSRPIDGYLLCCRQPQKVCVALTSYILNVVGCTCLPSTSQFTLLRWLRADITIERARARSVTQPPGAARKAGWVSPARSGCHTNERSSPACPGSVSCAASPFSFPPWRPRMDGLRRSWQIPKKQHQLELPIVNRQSLSGPSREISQTGARQKPRIHQHAALLQASRR